MTEWRESQAGALDDQQAAIAAALHELTNVEAVLEQRHRDKLAGELRGLAAGLRSEASAMATEARELRTTRGQRDGFPLALTAPATTHHPRGEHR